MCKIINLNDFKAKNTREHNPKWPQIPDHPDILSNLINHKSDIDKSYLYGQDPHETKHNAN